MVVGKRAEEWGIGGGELKRLVCRQTREWTRADETATFALKGERASGRRRRRGRDAHKDVLRYITVNKQLDRQSEGKKKTVVSCAKATGTPSSLDPIGGRDFYPLPYAFNKMAVKELHA